MFQSYFIGELLGTLFLVLFGCGVCAGVLLKDSKSNDAGWISIAAGWGFAVMIGIFVSMAAGSKGGDINPVITLMKYGLGEYTSGLTVILIIIAQFLGAFIGAIFVWLVYLAHWKPTECRSTKLSVFATAPAIMHHPDNFITEFLATTALVVIAGALAEYGNTYNFSDGSLPYIFGFVVWGIGLSLGGPTGYAINPARDFGPRLAHYVLPIQGKGVSHWDYSWVPILGPLAGSACGVLIIKLFLVKP